MKIQDTHIRKVLFAFSMAILWSFGAMAQQGQTVTINGDASIVLNSQKNYNVFTSASTYYWWISGSGGQIIGSNSSSSVTVKATSFGNFTLNVQLDNYTYVGSKSISVQCNPIGTPSTTQIQPTCSIPTGTITVTNFSQSNHTFSFDNGATYQATSSKSGLSPGTYYVKVKNSGGCVSSTRTATINGIPSAPSPPSVSDREICSGQTTTLTVSNPIPNGTYKWYLGGTEVGDQPSLTVSPSAGKKTYSVKVTDNLGCESNARLVEVNVIGLPAPSNNSPIRDCESGSTVELSVQNSKTVNGDVRNDMVHVWYSDQNRNNIVSHVPINDASSGTLATRKTITLQPGQSASYWVAIKVGNCEGPLEEVTGEYIDSSIDGGQVSAPPQTTICYGTDPGNMANSVLPSGGDGAFSYIWQYSDDNSIWDDIPGATSASYDPSGGLVGDRWYRRKALSCNRFGYSNTVPVSIRANVLQPDLQLVSQTTCSSPTGSFRITNHNSTYSYSVDPPTGVVAVNGDTFTVYQGTYTITATDNGCSSIASDPIEIFEQPFVPGKPLDPIDFDDSVCGEITLTKGEPNSTANATWYWQAEPTGTSTGPANLDPTVTLTAGSVYYLRAKHNDSNCWGEPRVIDYTINHVPLEASGSDVSRCGPGAVTLTASPGTHGDEIRWYTAASGGSPLTTGVSANTLEYTTSGIGATTTYFVESYNSTTGCFSPTRYAVQAIVDTGSATYYYDEDNDGLGDSNVSIQACTQPGGYVTNASDLCPDFQSPTNDCPIDPFDQNYVYTRTYREPRTTVPLQKFDEGGDGLFDVENEYVQDITYFDGLGRPMQQVGIRQSPNDQKDIVTHIRYDAYGRQDKEWLPLHEPDSAIGSYRYWDMERATKQYYKTHPVYGDDFTGLLEADVNAYSQKHFEPSPMNRVLRQAAPGEDWKLNVAVDDRSIEFDYTSNDTLQVRLFSVDLTAGLESPVLAGADDGFYPPGKLFKNVTKDENHDTVDGKLHTTEEFTDKQGRIVLKRTYADIPAMDRNGDGDTLDPGEEARPQEPHDTYYIYDDYSNLTYVLPPKMEASTATLVEINTDLAELGYQYVYDNRNRLVEKQLPGKEREYIIYNKLDQPVMTQDANLRANNEWLFTKYDAFGRVAYTGIYTHTGSISRVDMQSDLDNHYVDGSGNRNSTDMYEERDNASAANYNYTNATFPTANLDILTVNYFDDYNFDRAGTGETATALGVASAPDVKSLATGSKVKVLGTTDWITTVNYYDTKGRPIYSYTNNAYLGTVDIVENQLDFTGKPLKTKTTHTRNTVTIVTIDNFSYDHTGRLLAQTQCIGDETLGDSCTGGATANLPLSGIITDSRVATNSIIVTEATLLPDARLYIDPNATGTNGSEELILYNDYDELGLLIRKKVGGTPASAYATSQELQEVDYSYNVRGWLTGINDISDAVPNKLFNFRINYNDPVHGGTPQYFQNVAETEWKTANDNLLRWYRYDYDALYRLDNAVSHNGNYDVSMVYDKMGNLLTLRRDGWQDNGGTITYPDMDILDYDYGTGNKLTKVSDTGNVDYGFKDGTNTDDDYGYDANANMILDRNKGITSISYNHLDMPTDIAVNGNGHNGTIKFVYDATGQKLRRTTTEGSSITTTDYVGNFVYENDNLKQFDHPEGYIEPDGSGGYVYVYRYLDIWGDTRITYADDVVVDGSIDPATEIRREQNYYPGGLEHKGYNTVMNGVKNNLKTYQGQEFTEDLGLNFHEWRYRASYPDIVRFWQVDPLAEDYYYNSTFAFQENKFGIGTELEGLEVNRFDAYNRLKGFGRAIKDAAVGIVESAKYIGPTGVVQASADFAPVAAAIAEDPQGVASAVVDNVTESLKTPEGQGYAVGAILTLFDPSPAGETGAILKTTNKLVDLAEDIASPLLLTDGGNVPNAGGKITSFITEQSSSFFRVSDNGGQGGFLTKTKPSSSQFAQEALALPPGNNASLIQEVTVPAGIQLQRSRALPAFGRRGGGEQFQILNYNDRKLIDFGPAKPFNLDSSLN
ncbi:DUF6443 domain-containing protein [Ulvibacterium sp.]|uniref:DUF6443 domain-containing protein n=1 Tax=Ulvibacterium sp. TaxID=2665914 RepID=UPI003BAD1DFE